MIRNPFRNWSQARTKQTRHRSRLDRLIDILLLLGLVGAIGSLLAPGLLGVLVKTSVRTMGFLLVFLMVARKVSSRLGDIFNWNPPDR